MTPEEKIEIFDYYGLCVFYLSSDPEPLHVYAEITGRRMKASIAFKNGILDKIALEKTDGFAMPDETDQKNFMAVLDSYLPDVIRLWKDTFIYKKSVKKEIIQKKL